MILAPITHWNHYSGLGPSFAEAMGFLLKAVAAPAEFKLGRHAISEPDVYATLSEFEGRAPEKAFFEWHRRLADIHINLAGEESLGWAPGHDGLVLRTAFDESRDFGTYEGPIASTFALPRGYFAVFLPGELHIPGLGTGPVRKWVAKFPVGDGIGADPVALRR